MDKGPIDNQAGAPRSTARSPGPHIVVVGSLNLDLVARVPRLPVAGQTVTGRDLRHVPGGKGANQAVAVARLGGRCSMVGRVGNDDYGRTLRRSLTDSTVEEAAIVTSDEASTGVALISVEDSGQNTISVIPGANALLTPADVRDARSLIASADAVLVQLEVPLDAVREAIRLGNAMNKLTVLDPAPAPVEKDGLPADLSEVDLITPNQSEAYALTGIEVDTPRAARLAAEALLEGGIEKVVIKLGDQGAWHQTREGRAGHVRATPVKVVDTTAAGDAFSAALTLAHLEGQRLDHAVDFACHVGAHVTTRPGAQPSIPTREQVRQFNRG